MSSATAAATPEARPTLNLAAIYEPRSIAVVGASPKAGKRGRTVIDNLREAGYTGEILAVNPNYQDVLGLRCYPSVGALPTRPDVAAICLPSVAAVAALQECGKAGIPAAAMVAGGFAEAGPEGAALEAEVRRHATQYAITVAGPNSLGVVSRTSRVCYWAGLRYAPEGSGIAAIIQSGALALGSMSVLFERRIYLEAVAMPGNEAVVTASDHLEYLINQTSVRVVALVLDGIRDPAGFVRSAQSAAETGKQIVILKNGRSAGGRRAARAHTASMTGGDAVFDAVCRELGVVRVDDLDELLETAILASRIRIPPRPRLIVTSVSGAGCGLAADLADRAGLDLAPPSAETAQALAMALPGTSPANPLDVALAFDVPGSYRSCMESLAASHEYDVQLTVVNCPRSNDSNQDFDRSQVEDASSVARQCGMTLAITSFASGQYDEGMISIANDANVPLLQGLRDSLLAIRRLSDASSRGRPDRRRFAALLGGKNVGGRVLPPIDGFDLLRRCGIPVPKRRVVGTLADVGQACEEVGYPVAMKAWSGTIAHKTDLGGVVLGIDGPEAAEAAFDQIKLAVSTVAPDSAHEGVEIQEMVQGVGEIVVAAQRDPQFGPILVVGTGGTFVELLNDARIIIPPIDPEDAAEIVRSLRGYPFLAGARGRPRADVDALASAIVNFSVLAAALPPSYDSIEINPIVVRAAGGGVVAVDVLITSAVES